MKRTCVGCRAREYDVLHWLQVKCSLGYKIAVMGHATKPLEKCPKPRSIEDFCKLLEAKK